MNLLHLCTAPNIAIYFDTWNNWMYLEWHGDITLPRLQHACLAVAECFVGHMYPRILTNSASIRTLDWEVGPWLSRHFFPHLGLAGVEQLAWVLPPTTRGRSLAEQQLSRCGPNVRLALFADVEDAVNWLQQTQPDYASGCALLPRPAAATATLTRLVRNFAHELQVSKEAERPANPA